MKKREVVLNKEEEVRWISLLSAIDTVDKFCKENSKTFDDIEIKIPAIKHYMNETIDTFKLLQASEDAYDSNQNIHKLKSRITDYFLSNIKSRKQELAYR